MSVAVESTSLRNRKRQTSQAIYIETRISELDVSYLGKADILRQIKEAEDSVREMTRGAEERRKALQAEGKRMAIQRTEEAEAELRKRLEAETAKALAEIERRKKAILEDGMRKAEALTSTARGRMGDAKKYVLSEFERAVDA